jgi:hypothetical protein
VTVAIISLSVRMKYVDDKLNGTRAEVPGFGSEENAAEAIKT